MQVIHNKLTLDVNAAENKTVIVAKAEDDKSRYIDITLICAGEAIAISSNDRIILMAADKNTGNTVAAIDCTLSNGMIVAELKKTLLALPGQLRCEIVVYGINGSVLTSADFTVIVTDRINSEAVERENDFSALVSALSDVASTSDRIDEVSTRVQPVSLGGTGATDGITAAQNLKVPSLDVAVSIESGDDLNSYLTPGTYTAKLSTVSTLQNCPASAGFKMFVIAQQYSSYLVQIITVPTENEMWFRGCGTANTYSDWRRLPAADEITQKAIGNYIGSDIGKTDLDGSTHTTTEMLYGTDYNDLIDTGLYAIRGNSTYPTVNAPDGNNSNNVFQVLVFKFNSTFTTQIAVNVRAECDMYIRNNQTGGWGTWKKVLTTSNVIAESGVWTPVASSGTITVQSSHYVYDGKRVTVTATLTCGSNIDTSLVLTGLPIIAAESSGAVCAITGQAATVSGIVSQNTIGISSSVSLSGETITVSATYII